jgi:hypothetical protein
LTPDSRAFTPIEQPKLDAGSVGGDTHQAIQRVYLSHELSLADATDSWIAGHGADRIGTHRHQGGLRTDAGGRRSGFASGVPAADNDNIIVNGNRAHDEFALDASEILSSIRPLFHVKLLIACFT